MAVSFSPSRNDVERYRRLRAAATKLNHKILDTLPRHAIGEVGDAIGILRDGVLQFESEDMTSVLMDCCLYDWFEGGKNMVQRYGETHHEAPGSDEDYLLSAFGQAKYRIIVVQSTIVNAGLRCRDVLNNEDLFVMDIGLSQSALGPDAAFATRTVPLGEYWMTTGAGLPINSKQAALDALARVAAGKQNSLEGPGGLALMIVRTCLAAGAAQYISYGKMEPEPKPRRRRSRRIRWSYNS